MFEGSAGLRKRASFGCLYKECRVCGIVGERL